jgi:hypothetical protein
MLKVNIKKLQLFYISTVHNLRKKSGETIQFTIASKTIKYLGLNLTKETKEVLMKTINH